MENSKKEKGRGKGREKECTTSRKVKLVSQQDIPKEQSTHLRTVQVVSDKDRFADAKTLMSALPLYGHLAKVEPVDAYLRVCYVPFELKTYTFNVWAKDLKRMVRRLMGKNVSIIFVKMNFL